MSGTQQQVGENGTQQRKRGAPPRKAGAKRTRRTAAQIAAAALPAASPNDPAPKLPRDAVLMFAEQTRTRMLALSPAEQIAAKAWLKASLAA
jgi:hypothetical protein